MTVLKIQKRRDDDLKYHEWEDVSTDDIFRVVLEGGDTFEISQLKELKDGLEILYLVIRTSIGTLAIYPNSSNKFLLRQVLDT